MPQFNVAVDFEVFCGKCGRGLCNLSTTGHTPRRGELYLDVEPCPNCLEQAREEAYSKGYDTGYEEASNA